MRKSSKVFNAKIKGHDWKFYAQSSSTYNRKHGTDSHAITYTKDREIYFKISELSPDYVRHEVFHAYIASCSTNSSQLTKDQMEELCAELFGEHGAEMNLLVDQILNFFLR
jgi:hypothetical protein